MKGVIDRSSLCDRAIMKQVALGIQACNGYAPIGAAYFEKFIGGNSSGEAPVVDSRSTPQEQSYL